MMAKQFSIWGLIILYYLAAWGVPGYVIYDTYKVQIEAHVGGGFMYFLFSILFILLFTKIRAKVTKMDSTGTKVVFGTGLSVLLLYIARAGSNFIAVNLVDLDKIFIWAISGQLIAAVIAFVALKIDKAYVKEINLI